MENECNQNDEYSNVICCYSLLVLRNILQGKDEIKDADIYNKYFLFNNTIQEITQDKIIFCDGDTELVVHMQNAISRTERLYENQSIWVSMKINGIRNGKIDAELIDFSTYIGAVTCDDRGAILSNNPKCSKQSAKEPEKEAVQEKTPKKQSKFVQDLIDIFGFLIMATVLAGFILIVHNRMYNPQSDYYYIRAAKKVVMTYTINDSPVNQVADAKIIRYDRYGRALVDMYVKTEDNNDYRISLVIAVNSSYKKLFKYYYYKKEGYVYNWYGVDSEEYWYYVEELLERCDWDQKISPGMFMYK